MIPSGRLGFVVSQVTKSRPGAPPDCGKGRKGKSKNNRRSFGCATQKRAAPLRKTDFWEGEKSSKRVGVRGFPGHKIETWGTPGLWGGEERQKQEQPQVLRLRNAKARCSAQEDRFLGGGEKSALPDFEDDDGFVVEAVLAVLEAAYVGEDGFGDFAGGELAVAAEHGG
jgi:hypothetical protein